MHITSAHVNQIVAWDLRDGPAVVRVVSVSRDALNPSIIYESSDGHREILIEELYTKLDDFTRDWRPASMSEAADFAARYRPAPQNWD